MPTLINKFIKQCEKCNDVRLNNMKLGTAWGSMFLTCDCLKNKNRFYHIAITGDRAWSSKSSSVLNNINKWNYNNGWHK